MALDPTVLQKAQDLALAANGDLSLIYQAVVRATHTQAAATERAKNPPFPAAAALPAAKVALLGVFLFDQGGSTDERACISDVVAAVQAGDGAALMLALAAVFKCVAHRSKDLIPGA